MSYLRNHKLLLAIIGVLLLANIVLLYLLAFRHPHGYRYSEKEMRENAKARVKKEVGLSDAQLMQYDSLRNHQFNTMRPLFEDLLKAKEDFFKLIYQEGVSDSLLLKKAAVIGEKQQAIDLKTFRYFQSVRALCTQEQKPKMDSFIQQIVKRIINPGGRRGPGPATEKTNK